MHVHYMLMTARHDNLMRSAARYRLAAEARRYRAQRHQHRTTVPAGLVAAIRARRIRPVSL